MHYTVHTTIQSGNNEPAVVKWYTGDNHASALAAMVGAAAHTVDPDNNLPKHMQYRVLAVSLNIIHPEEEPHEDYAECDVCGRKDMDRDQVEWIAPGTYACEGGCG